jgi:membrane fusion protein (multidrug efflux system)
MKLCPTPAATSFHGNIRKTFINSPLQRRGTQRDEFKNRFNGFRYLNETVETVSPADRPLITPLKRGVNERYWWRKCLRFKVTCPLVAITALLACFGCKQKAQTKSPPPLVEVATVTQGDVPIYHEWIGVLDGLVNAQIRAQVTGYLLTQNYREGDPIKKGDLLFEIDPRPFKAALDQTKGLLAQAEAKLGKTELDVKRYGPLVKDKAISQEEYDDAVQANLEAQAAVISAKAQVEQAQLNFEFTRITSPIDGIASIARAQIGDLVGPATGELTTVSTVDPIKVYYNVTEQAYINFSKQFTTENDRYGRLRQLDIDLILTDGSVYPLKGKIWAADRQIGLTTGALRVEALFPNPGNSLRPGEFARVRVKLDLKRDSILVPQRAVSELQGSYQVVVVDADSKIHIQLVRIGDRTGDLWAIEEGLHPGDRVVVEGTQKVREGVTVITTNFVPEQIAQTAPASATK